MIMNSMRMTKVMITPKPALLVGLFKIKPKTTVTTTKATISIASNILPCVSVSLLLIS